MTAFTYFKDQWTPIIDDYLAKHLASEVKDQKISQIMAYSVMAGGKRLRPLLFLATLNTLGKKIEGEAEAILAGDALLPMGIQWIAEGSNSAQLVELITKAVGPNGMVGGQYLDIDSTNNASVSGDAKFINKMEWLKTGCLIQASVEMAAIFAKASDIEKVKLIDFAKVFGRSYQIYDDLVDVVETSEEAGKATHKDEAEGKNNTLTLLGIDQSRKELTDLIKQAQDDLHGLNDEVLTGFLDLYQKVL